MKRPSRQNGQKTFLTTKPCDSKCRAWGDCAGKEFYRTNDIFYCRHQCLWLCAEFFKVESGEIVFTRDTWPPDTYISGYTEAEPTQHSINAHAPYEEVMRIIGELDYRLKKTGEAGRFLIHEVRDAVAGRGDIAEALHSLVPSNEARWALGYVNGWVRKRMSFLAWRKQKSYLQSKVVKILPKSSSRNY